MSAGQKSRFWGVFLLTACFSFASVITACSSGEGWGVLLWSTDDPPVQSGTVLQVSVRSSINKVWVLNLPANLRGGGDGKLEVPLPRFELVGSKSKALKRAQDFSRYALTYAENLQDGLPIRAFADNNSNRVYRLRSGEIIKILTIVDGVPAISASGDPLPGDWYQVLAEDGSKGYCFSYRLRLFEHSGGGTLADSVPPEAGDAASDSDLDTVLSKKWSPESYLVMINDEKIDFEELSRRRRFDLGQDTGTARIYTSEVDRSFSYTAIRPDGSKKWRFEGTSLTMQLRSETLLAVQYTEGSGSYKTLLFVSLPDDVDEIAKQESTRRDQLYNIIFSQGPVFTSNNYGTITFREGRGFIWEGYDLLVPRTIPESADGRGTIAMDLFLDPSITDRNGAFTLRFAGRSGGQAAVLRCMYSLDSQGFRIEVVPESNIEEVTVTRRDTSPMVIYFFKDSPEASADSPPEESR
jgi:hypothetical protein